MNINKSKFRCFSNLLHFLPRTKVASAEKLLKLLLLKRYYQNSMDGLTKIVKKDFCLGVLV